MPGTLRTFVALALRDRDRDRLAAWASTALGSTPGLRLVPAANLHATLVFCGPLEEADHERVVAVTREEAPGGVRCTLEPHAVAVLGSVVAATYTPGSGAEELRGLQGRLAARLAAEGLAAVASRPWLAHVTLARARRGERPAIGRLGPPAGELSPSGVAVYTTVPLERGVAYRPLVLLGDDANADGIGAAVPEEAEVAEEKSQALQAALGQIEKQFGKGSIMRMGDESHVSVAAISTGSLVLDVALGIGGVPRGRIIEIFGPESSGKTTLCYHIMAEAQKAGGTCAFIDAEHAMDPQYARRIGLDVDELLVSQPDNGEQALEISEMLIRSGALDVVCIDSVAALVPKAEIEGEMGDSFVGLQARLMSQALRKLAGTLNRTGTVCIFTNQLREKIGVMFGCFHYDARVVLADGSTEKIGKIVNQRLPVEVMSMDPATGVISPKAIVSYFDNGPTDEFWQFEVEAGGASGRRKFACTPNHLIFTPLGEREAGELQVGDEVLVGVKDYALTDSQRQLVYGGVLGDASLRKVSEHGVAFRVGHGEKQTAYCEWKRSMLAPYAHEMAPTGAGIGFDTVPVRELQSLHQAVYAGVGGGKKQVTPELVAQLDERAIAVWYADDGTFSGSYARWGHGKAEICATSLDRESRELLALRCEELGMGRATVTGRGLLFSGERTRRFHERIAPYIHPNLDYKLHPDLRGRFAWTSDQLDAEGIATLASRRSLSAVPMRITKKYRKPQTRATHRFDLEIEGNHTYLVDHVVVHNSPETTTGGRALKFYASVRLDIRRIETLKDGAEAYGNRVRVKVVKNKVAPPFRQAEFDIVYGDGISWEGSVLDVALERKIVTKSGSFFSFGDERLGQGRERAKAFLREHPDTLQAILNHIQADSEGIVITGATVPPPGAAEGEVPLEVAGAANGVVANGAGGADH